MTTTADKGRFGAFGGRYVPETLIPALDELATAFDAAVADSAFAREVDEMLSTYVGRPSPLSSAPRLSEALGATVFLKREDLNHTGAHKINNTVGQVLLARRMGKRRIIAETGAGQHGVATATVCARYGLECVVYMGEEDIRRQALNVYRMRLLGAEVIPVTSGTRTLKDATSEAIRDWVTNVEDTLLRHRLGRGAGSVSDDGARFPVGHRQRSADADSRSGRTACLRRSRVRGRRIERDGDLSRIR